MSWTEVEEAIGEAKAMHFDGCHKIYLSMDDAQVKEFEEIGYEVVAPNLDTLKDWFEESCGLRFISAVHTVEGNPNDGYKNLISQFEMDEDDEDDDEDGEDTL